MIYKTVTPKANSRVQQANSPFKKIPLEEEKIPDLAQLRQKFTPKFASHSPISDFSEQEIRENKRIEMAVQCMVIETTNQETQHDSAPSIPFL